MVVLIVCVFVTAWSTVVVLAPTQESPGLHTHHLHTHQLWD